MSNRSVEKKDKNHKTAMIYLLVFLFVVLVAGYLTISKPKQQAPTDKIEVPKLASIRTVEPDDTNNITGSFITEGKEINPMQPGSMRIHSTDTRVVESYNTEPPLDAAGVWQGVFELQRKKQLFITAHSGVLSGTMIASLEKGDTVELKDYEGVQRTYIVEYSRNLDDYGNDIQTGKNYYDETVNTTEDRLVLQTCFTSEVNYMVYAYPEVD